MRFSYIYPPLSWVSTDSSVCFAYLCTHTTQHWWFISVITSLGISIIKNKTHFLVEKYTLHSQPISSPFLFQLAFWTRIEQKYPQNSKSFLVFFFFLRLGAGSTHTWYFKFQLGIMVIAFIAGEMPSLKCITLIRASTKDVLFPWQWKLLWFKEGKNFPLSVKRL